MREAAGVVSVDGQYVRGRLERDGKRLSDEERAALVRRLDRRLKELEQENSRLKRLVADQALDLSIHKEVSRGNF